MIRRGLIAGTAADWIKVLSELDRGARRLPPREQNFTFDNVVTAQDAEAEARAAARERLTRRPLPRLKP